MKLKTVIVVLGLLLFSACGGEVKPVSAETQVKQTQKSKDTLVWGSGDSIVISIDEYDKATLEYIKQKYPKKVRKIERQRIIDKQTTTINGLMWQDNKASNAITKSWHAAKKYCKELSLVSYSDWRLASKSELTSLYKNKNKLKNFSSNDYWSSTTDVGDEDYAWYVGFYDGYVYYDRKYSNYYVRCVRAGQ